MSAETPAKHATIIQDERNYIENAICETTQGVSKKVPYRQKSSSFNYICVLNNSFAFAKCTGLLTYFITLDMVCRTFWCICATINEFGEHHA